MRSEPRKRFDGKVALVTGGASGFGAAVVEQLRGEGASVVIADLDGAKGPVVASELGVRFVRCDVSKGNDVAAAVAAAVEAFGRLDIVVNNAGTTYAAKPSDQVTEEEFDHIYAVNVKSLFHMHQHATPHLRTSGHGVVINVSSITGVRPAPGLCWYGGTKAAMIGITKGLAQELAPTGIRVCAVNPMLGDTPLLPRFMGMPDTPENRQRFLSRIPLGRLADPSDVANAVLFLASDESSYLTGITLDVDGGRNI